MNHFSMMTNIIVLIWVHIIADFFLQNDKMALNKSTNSFWLGAHVIVYMAPLFLWGWKFAVLNGLAHFIIDWVTSRGTSYLWKKEQRHWFFALIGVDQGLHLTVLLLTLQLLRA